MSETTTTTSGVNTSEYALANSVKFWSILFAVLGMVESIGATVASSLGADTKIGIIVGAVVTVAGVIGKTLASLGYSKARADVKVAAAEAVTTTASGTAKGPELL